MNCQNCGETIPAPSRSCPACGIDVGFPNVREANRKESKEALEQRYQEAISKAEIRGALNKLNNFEEKVKDSQAVINMDLDSLLQWIKSEKNLYSTYHLGVESEIRIPALQEDDRKRRMAEAALFSGYEGKIRYAALTLDGKGLSSYGEYSLSLKAKMIRHRATLLEENSFDFMKTQNS